MNFEGNNRNGTTDNRAAMSTTAPIVSSSLNDTRSGATNTIVTPDGVVRILSGELLRAKLTGREGPLSADEARALASIVVANLTALYSKLPFGAAALTSALHLGLGPYFGYSGITDSTLAVHVEARPTAAGDATIPVYSISLQYKPGSRSSINVSFDELAIGNIPIPPSKFDSLPKQADEFDTSVAELDSLTDAEFELDTADSPVAETTWKQRYMKLRAQMQKRERSLSQYKRKILESVMADI
jgi:hypothetical protein